MAGAAAGETEAVDSPAVWRLPPVGGIRACPKAYPLYMRGRFFGCALVAVVAFASAGVAPTAAAVEPAGTPVPPPASNQDSPLIRWRG
jgi:hypothetical protein